VTSILGLLSTRMAGVARRTVDVFSFNRSRRSVCECLHAGRLVYSGCLSGPLRLHGASERCAPVVW
jgi:hypothetical protein